MRSIEELLLEQSRTIEQLAALCKELTAELALYRSVEAEENRIEQLTGGQYGATD